MTNTERLKGTKKWKKTPHPLPKSGRNSSASPSSAKGRHAFGHGSHGPPRSPSSPSLTRLAPLARTGGGSGLRNTTRPGCECDEAGDRLGHLPHTPLWGEVTMKDIRSRGRTDGSSRRHSSSGQLLNSSRGTALAGTARSWDMFRQPAQLQTSPATAKTGNSRPPGRPCELSAGASTIERKRAAFLVSSSRARLGREPGLSGRRRTRLTGTRFPSRGSGVARGFSAAGSGSFPGCEHSRVWIAGNATLRRFGEVRAEVPRFATVCPMGL